MGNTNSTPILGRASGTIAAPQIAVTPHAEMLVFDPSAPKVFRFRMHLENKEPHMTLLLTEADVRSLLTMPIALEIVEESLRQQGNGELILHPRRRIKLPDNALLHYMAAADPVRGYIGMKLYTVVRGVARFVVPLFRSTTGEMAALIEADALGQLRTGAASGVATKYLANANARTACIIGTGYQARTQLEAVAAVRRLERVRAFGRDPERRAKFCREMSERIGVASAFLRHHRCTAADRLLRGPRRELYGLRWTATGAARRLAPALCALNPRRLTFHSGSPQPLDRDHLARLKVLCDRYQPKVFPNTSPGRRMTASTSMIFCHCLTPRTR